jgi:hypothetical protein
MIGVYGKAELPQHLRCLRRDAGRSVGGRDISTGMRPPLQQHCGLGKHYAAERGSDIGPYRTATAQVIGSASPFVPVDLRRSTPVAQAPIHVRGGLGRLGTDIKGAGTGLRHDVECQGSGRFIPARGISSGIAAP